MHTVRCGAWGLTLPLLFAARTDDHTKVEALREKLDDVGPVPVKILKLLL